MYLAIPHQSTPTASFFSTWSSTNTNFYPFSFRLFPSISLLPECPLSWTSLLLRGSSPCHSYLSPPLFLWSHCAMLSYFLSQSFRGFLQSFSLSVYFRTFHLMSSALLFHFPGMCWTQVWTTFLSNKDLSTRRTKRKMLNLAFHWLTDSHEESLYPLRTIFAPPFGSIQSLSPCSRVSITPMSARELMQIPFSSTTALNQCTHSPNVSILKIVDPQPLSQALSDDVSSELPPSTHILQNMGSSTCFISSIASKLLTTLNASLANSNMIYEMSSPSSFPWLCTTRHA